MKTKNILWGIFFVCAAVLLVLGQMGYFEELEGVSIWNFVIAVLLIPIMVTSLWKLNFFGVFFPLGLILYTFAQPLGIESIALRHILLAALLLSIGFSLIFPGKNKSWKTGIPFIGCDWDCDWEDGIENAFAPETKESANGEFVFFQQRFGGSSKYLNSKCLKNVKIACSFGGMAVYFEDAQLSPEGAVVNIEMLCAGAELYIPREWNVENKITATLGGVEETRRNRKTAAQDGPTLVLKGNIRLSGIEIIYV